MATDLMAHALTSIREAEPLWSDATIAKCEADSTENGQKVSGIVWADGVHSVVFWPMTWAKPAWANLHSAYFWGTIGRDAIHGRAQ